MTSPLFLAFTNKERYREGTMLTQKELDYILTFKQTIYTVFGEIETLLKLCKNHSSSHRKLTILGLLIY